jgi:hypothetical protein
MGSEPHDPAGADSDPDPEREPGTGVEVDEEDEDEQEEVDTSHLDGAADGCGCTEMWEHLADQRGE